MPPYTVFFLSQFYIRNNSISLSCGSKKPQEGLFVLPEQQVQVLLLRCAFLCLWISLWMKVSEPLDEQVIRKITKDKLRGALLLLSVDEQELIYGLFYENLSEREYAAQKGVYHNAIHNKKIRILKKLKKFLDN